MHILRVSIDDRSYTVRAASGVHATLAAMQEKMRRAAVDRLELSTGQEVIVNWATVTTLLVRGADEDDA